MRNFYGITPYPTPPLAQERLQFLVANDIMETSADFISDVVFDPVSRSDVGQGPLIKVSAESLPSFPSFEGEKDKESGVGWLNRWMLIFQYAKAPH